MMNARRKSALLIIGTLLAGIAIGVLVTNLVVNRRLDRMRDVASRSGFNQSVIEAIGPNSDAQREEIEAIINDTHRAMDGLRRDWRRGARAASDSMRSSLNAILTPAQRENLDDWYSRFQRRSRRDNDGGDRNRRDGERRSDRDGDGPRSRSDSANQRPSGGPPPPPPGN